MSTETMAKVAQQVARNVHRKNGWIDKADLLQEAWVGMLKALPAYQEGLGTLEGYLAQAAIRECRRLIWRVGSAVYVPKEKHATSNLAVFRSIGPSEELLKCEAGYEDTEATLEAQERKARVAQVVARYLAEGREGEAARLVLLEGEAVRDVTEKVGMPARAITNICTRLRTAIKTNKASRSALEEVL